MKITCPACDADYNVDSSRIPPSGMSMRCPKCSHSFRVTPDGQSTSAGRGGAGGGASQRYYVKRPTGKVFGPFDSNAIKMMLKSNKLGDDVEVSTDKQTWQPLAAVSVFAGLVGAASSKASPPKKTMMGGWQQAPASADASAELPAPAIGSRLPVPKIDRSASDLPVSAGAPGLPARKSDDVAPLPGLTGNADLPAPREKAALPTPRGGIGLPGRRENAELPTSASNLPTPGSNLPRTAGSNLPGPALDRLPRSAGKDLPVLADSEEEELFGPSADSSRGDDLFGPAGDEESDLFGSPPGDDLFGDDPEDDGDDLFGAAPDDDGDDFFGAGPDDDGDDFFGAGPDDEEDDLFGASPDDEEDDFFGAGAEDDGDDLFGAAPGDEEDDLFGAGAAEKEDDLFGAPGDHTRRVDDDLFGALGAEDEDEDDEDDLFGAMPGGGDDDLFGGGEGGSDDDLFASPDASGEKDFLGGDKNFSFLDDGPRPEPEDDWGDDLFGDAPEPPGARAVNLDPASEGDWGDDLLDSPRRTASSSAGYEADDAFRPKSQGPREASAPESAVARKDRVVDEDKKRGNMMMVGLPLVLILFAAIGWVVYDNFFSAVPTQTGETKKKVAPPPADVSAATLKPDNYSDYAAVVERAAAGKVAKDKQGELLLAQSLMLSRYENEETEKAAGALAKTLVNAKSGFEAVGRGAFEARSGNADAARAYLEPFAGEKGDLGYFANLAMGLGDVLALQREIARERSADASETQGAEKNADAGAEVDAPADQKNSAAAVKGATRDPKKIAQNYEALTSRARGALQTAASLAPEAAAPHYWLGRLHQGLGEGERALKSYTRAIELSADHVASLLSMGTLYYEQGELNEAIARLEKINGELGAKAAPVEKARAHHVAGLVHVARRQSDMAIESFTKALSIDSSRSDTLRALAEEYERSQKYKEALNFFTTNKNLGQKDPEVMLGIVRSHMGLEQWNEAIAQLEEAQKLFEDDARFPFYLGQLYQKRGAFFDAQKPLERAVEIDPNLLTAYATLAQLAWRMDKDIQRGEKYIEHVVSKPDLIDAEVASLVAEYYHMSNRRDVAEDWYEMALERDPNHWPARLALSRLLLEENKGTQARDLLERARKEGVQDMRLSAYLADAYRQLGQYDRAIDEINQVIEQYPKNEEYVYIRGRIHFDRGNLENAQEDFSRAYDLNPRYHQAYFYVGRTAFEKGDFSTALKIFRHVLDYQPDRGEYRFYMGRTLENENRSSQALDEYRKATAVDPAYGVENPMVYVYRGRLLSRLGYSREGKKDIARALELAPENVQALLAMAESEYSDKNYDLAIQHFRKALSSEPEHPAAQYRLGMALLFTERSREAAERLQMAVKHGYDDPQVYQRLGYLYKELGQRSLALESFKKFLEKTQDVRVPAVTKREVLSQIEQLQ